MAPDDTHDTPGTLPLRAAPELTDRINIALLGGMNDALASMAADAGFNGRHPVPDYIRAVLEARVEHERPEDYRRIKGAA